MINAENEASVPGGPPLGPEGQARPSQLEMKNLRPEELKMYKECVSSLYYKAGIPFALACHFLSTRMKAEGDPLPRNYLKRGFLFLGNVLLGSLLFTPTCFYKLLAMREAADKRAREMQMENPSFGTEESASTTRTSPALSDDFSYPVDLMTNLNEPEGNFSSDFTGPTLLTTDDIKDDKDPKVRSTTYDELRAKHRSRYANKPPAPFSSLSEPILSTPVDKPKTMEDPSSGPRPRRVVKNKYGDEIE